MSRRKFSFDDSLVDETLKAITDFGIIVERIESEMAFTDPKDLVFYEVALGREDSFLVTGNIKHFPKKPFIVTPVEMLAIINEMETIEHRVLSEPATGYGKW